MEAWLMKAVEYIDAKRTLSFALGAVLGAVVVTSVAPAEQTAVRPEASVVQPMATDGPKPERLLIPRLDIDASFEAPLGITENGEVAVPDGYETVGWYQYGPPPGEFGPAVVLGHVDSHTGPAVFYSLGQLVEGDEIFIERDDGSIAVFAVTTLERPSQETFPTERVYGNIDHAGLRLITCTGTYDRAHERYTHNLIVYAALVRTESNETYAAVAGISTSENEQSLSRTSSPIAILFEDQYQTVWWLLIILGIFFSWSVYEDRIIRNDAQARAVLLRNVTFCGVYISAVLIFFMTGLLELFWWLLAIAWIVMVIADRRVHQAYPGWDAFERDRFYGGASLFFILTALFFGFPEVWWPFFFIGVTIGIPYMVALAASQPQEM